MRVPVAPWTRKSMRFATITAFRGRSFGATLVLGLLICVAAKPVQARGLGLEPRTDAELSSDVSASKPWAIGVAAERQQAALALLLEGNALFWDSSFMQAAEKYRMALREWDHPMIHYNLALALSNLDKPVEVHRELLASLRYGGEPLEEEIQRDARRRLQISAAQIAQLSLLCDEPGAIVAVDGKQAFVGPGRRTELLVPGRHRVLVTKVGLMPRTYDLELPAGTRQVLQTRIYSERQLVEVHRPMPFWVPVTTAAAGTIVLITGAALNARSNALIHHLQSEIDRAEECRHGCPDASDVRRDSDRLKTASTVAYVVGATTLTGGAIGIWFNRARERRYTPEERDRQTKLAPLLGAGMWGVTAYGKF